LSVAAACTRVCALLALTERRSTIIASEPAATREQMDWLASSHTAPASRALRAWQRLGGSRVGRWLFAREVCRRAPYFRSIDPRFIELGPTACRVQMRRRRAVENHHGTLHALAMGNLCELAAGMVTEVTLPAILRWIPRGMTIEYLRKAETDVVAHARLDRTEWQAVQNVAVPVSVYDAAGTEVVRAVITMHVAAR
jgi:acyl-coenzyme A thioesterase PaaI-like protein